MTRRDLSLLLPLLAAADASGQKPPLTSKTYPFGDLPVKTNPNGNTSRAVMNGTIQNGFPLEMHISELGPGMMPHPPHHHGHDEMVIVRQGTLAVTVKGNTTTVGPGSVIFYASGDEHGMKNVGADKAMYYVIALGKD
ncbi:MAG TPA: cupin domain-containing protein [Bryobacteraceae bacterium]